MEALWQSIVNGPFACGQLELNSENWLRLIELRGHVLTGSLFVIKWVRVSSLWMHGYNQSKPKEGSLYAAEYIHRY